MTTRQVKSSPDEMIAKILNVGRDHSVCILDSCNASHPSADRLIVGIDPIERFEMRDHDVEGLLATIDDVLTGDKAAIFTVSYDFGNRLHGIGETKDSSEPDIFVAFFDELFIHNYGDETTSLTGHKTGSERFNEILRSADAAILDDGPKQELEIEPNFTRSEYLAAVEEIKERIKRGDTYQTNLTQRLTIELSNEVLPQDVFRHIRKNSPVPFAGYIERPTSTVVSASPERFFRVAHRMIEASPIKGTRPRGRTSDKDDQLLRELINSSKDRAENTMIVDLLRNDLGRLCEYGSVRVSKLCEPMTLPAVHHLYSTIDGRLRSDAKPSDIISALFPCGSITGAPKLSTMRIIDELEPDARGLSMGAIGVYIPQGFSIPPVLDLSVAIRTIVIRESVASFNVGGGITIDSDPVSEYQESWTKAKPLLDALGCERPRSTFDRSDAEHIPTGVV